ncbi:MAG: putative binding protein component of ABC iron transporter [Dehalococcoidia bacterium]|nr:putative binding protein component of ABC iron transporter [Bacillota bacterium]MBT9143886.1 putative binding protein component of ABC iron transporter [Bacillota bacterium]
MKTPLNNSFRRLGLLLLTTLILVTIIHSVAQATALRPIRVVIDGTALTMEATPQIRNGRIMVPFRAVTERLGAQVNWNGRERSVTVTKGEMALRLVVGQTAATNSGRTVTLEAAPLQVAGHVLVPLRFLSTGLGYLVHWDSATRSVIIRSAAEQRAGGVVNLYTSRHYGVEPVFTAFTRATGIRVRFTTGSDAVLRERIRAEGRHTPADIYMAVDAGNLWLAGRDGLLEALNSATLTRNIPSTLRDPGNRWFGLTQRVRTIMYHPDRVRPGELSTYEDLADPKWRGRLVMRPATHSYTQSLVASMIAAHGEARAEEIVRGWVANQPTLIDSDTRILETLAAGRGDVAITNHYYLGRLLQANPAFPVRIFWANQDNRGAHVNVSGAGVTAHAPNRENAIKLLEWLSGPEGQKLFADSNHEYPANPNVASHPIIAGFGSFRRDPLNMAEYGRLQEAAVRLLDRAGYR